MPSLAVHVDGASELPLEAKALGQGGSTMKRVAMVTLAVVVISSATYLAYTYFDGNRASGKPAVKISDISERVSFEDLGLYFAGYKGAFVLFDKNKNEYVTYDEAQSQQRVSPCSTFKIVNSLIGLETGVLADENTVFKWDGKQDSVKEWNKDHTMASAFRNSVDAGLPDQAQLRKCRHVRRPDEVLAGIVVEDLAA